MEQSWRTYTKLIIDKCLNWIKNTGWQDRALIIFLFVYCIFQLYLLSSFVQIPGPIYGGDLYNHFGHINHINSGQLPFMSYTFLGEYEHYPWLVHILVVIFSMVTGLSILGATLCFPIIISILAGILAYLCGMKIFGNKTIALILATLWTSSSIVTGTHPSVFSRLVMVPLLVYSFICLNNNNNKSSIFVGVVYGLSGLTHITLFLGANLLLFLDLLSKLIGLSKLTILSFLKKYMKHLLIVLVIGLPIAMLFWYPLIFVYGGETLNPFHEFTSGGVDALSIAKVPSFVSKTFFNLSNFKSIIFSVLSVFGLVVAFCNRKKYLLPILLYLVGFFGYFHPLITKPLLGISLGHYRFSMFCSFAQYLFVALALYYLYNKITKIKKSELFRYVFLGAIGVLILSFFIMNFNFTSNDEWVQYGQSLDTQTQAFFNLADYISNNVNIDNSVFISPHGETAFALNAVTGAKVLHMRRTHANPFVDINKRIADTAVILYGNNSEVRKELIEKYNVKYLVMDDYSYMGMSNCYNNWDLFDLEENADSSYNCLRVSSLEYRDYLEENGLEVKEVNARLDPSQINVPKFDLLIIKPRDTMEFSSLIPLFAYPADVELPTVALYEIII